MALLAGVGLGATSLSVAQMQRYSFSGGPDSSKLQLFADRLSTLLSRSIEGVSISYTASAGAMENLDRVGSGRADFGIVYAGDLYRSMYLHTQGAASPHRNVQVLSFLFGLQAHLIVGDSANISTAQALAGRRVVVGAAGSSAAVAAQRFFESLGIWHQITPLFIPPDQGAAALAEDRADALWVFATIPSAAVLHTAASISVRMLSLDAANLIGDHPFYTRVTIPAGTYPGVDHDVLTIQDAALWVAGAHVPAELTYRAITEAYSDAGLDFMQSISSSAGAMRRDNALSGAMTPLHEGAQRYWREENPALTSPPQ